MTEDLIARLTASIRGLRREEVAGDRQSPAVAAQMAKIQTQAQATNVRGTPAFEIGRTGGTLRPLEVTSLETGQFAAAIDSVLAG